MNLFSIYRSLGPVDVKNVLRDELLGWILAVPLLIALLYRFGVPPLDALLARELAFDLTPYDGLLMSFFLMTAPTMIGMVVGFLLLDERDDRVMAALLVTPMPLSGYLLYRISGPLLLGYLITLVGYPLAGLAPIPASDLVVIALLASLNGPVVALFLAVFAENKVAGFAMVKVLNTFNMVPVAAYFLDPPWQWAAGVIPAYWPMQMLWLATAGMSYGGYLLGGLAASGLVLWLLLRRFTAVVHR